MNTFDPVQRLILVVDDEQAVLDEVSSVLAGIGFACQCCQTAEAAVTAAATARPDLILADVNLHGASGVEMCQRIRQNGTLANVPVMFLSSAQIPDVIRRSDGGHGTYYLRKPFAAQVLVELIDRAIGAERELVGGRG